MKTNISPRPAPDRQESEGMSWQLLLVIAVIVTGPAGIVLKGIGLF